VGYHCSSPLTPDSSDALNVNIGGIPHLAKNERDVGHPSLVREPEFSAAYCEKALAGLLARLRSLELSLEGCLMHRLFVQQQLRRLQVRIGVEPILHDVVVKQVEHG